MAETVNGGAYQNPDGSWVDANGKRIAKPAKFPERTDREAARIMVAQQALAAGQFFPGQVLTTGSSILPSGEEYEKPEDELPEGEPEKARKSTKKQKS